MVITDGTTELTFSPSNDKINPDIEASTKRTAGGNVRRVVGGEKFKVNTTVRITSAEYRDTALII